MSDWDLVSPETREIMLRVEREKQRELDEEVERVRNERMVRELHAQSESLLLRSARSKEKRLQRAERALEHALYLRDQEVIKRLLLEQALRDKGIL